MLKIDSCANGYILSDEEMDCPVQTVYEIDTDNPDAALCALLNDIISLYSSTADNRYAPRRLRTVFVQGDKDENPRLPGVYESFPKEVPDIITLADLPELSDREKEILEESERW